MSVTIKLSCPTCGSVKTDALPLATAATTRITCGWCGAASTFAELLAASIDQSADARQLRERDFIRRC